MLGLSDKNVGVAPLCSRLTPSPTETADDPTWSYLQEKACQGIDPADCRPRLQVYELASPRTDETEALSLASFAEVCVKGPKTEGTTRCSVASWGLTKDYPKPLNPKKAAKEPSACTHFPDVEKPDASFAVSAQGCSEQWMPGHHTQSPKNRRSSTCTVNLFLSGRL